MQPWSESVFRERIERRATELGRSVRSVLRKAGVSEDYLKRPAQRGRRLDALEQIAGALDWSLGELLGWDFSGAGHAVDVDLLDRALVIADMVIGDNLPIGTERRAALARVAARVYDLLIERVAAGFPAHDDMDIELIAASFRRAGAR